MGKQIKTIFLEEQEKDLLVQRLNSLRNRLEGLLDYNNKEDQKVQPVDPQSTDAYRDSAFDRLCRIFGLSGFEREILLLSAGIELDSRFPLLCAKLHENTAKQYCTFGLALSVLRDPHWSALNPCSPLRRYKLVELDSSESLTGGRLKIDEKILHYITGISYPDERLSGFVSAVTGNEEVTSSYDALVQSITALKKKNSKEIIQVVGEDKRTIKLIAEKACSRLNMPLLLIKSSDVPLNVADRVMFSELLERESKLDNYLFLIETDPVSGTNYDKNLDSFLSTTDISVILSGSEALRSDRKITFLEVPVLEMKERSDLWHSSLGPLSKQFNGQIEKAAYHFKLNAPDISSISLRLLNEEQYTESTEELGSKFWNFCRSQTRRNMENLAQRIESNASWDDIVLPEYQKKILHEIAVHLKESFKVYETWGFRDKSLRGMGISTLFSGASGTGKTLAAEILASELKLDLYRIDLSSVVSKYIGETEKNLKRVFDCAEQSGAILLFDEADALFGKRSEVKDSHDRYANIEVSYLLQRMELYRGITILTTNLRNSLDSAFTRRIRFIIQFPFPDKNQRSEIWRNIFPKLAPLDKVDYSKLARLNITGGNIRNIALNAAFLAANNNVPVSMEHILHSAKNEYVKLEKSLASTEIEGWL